MINIGIIGGGKIGSVLYKMLSTDLRFKVTLADKEPHCDAVILDVTDKNSLNSFVLQQNAIINAMPYTFNKIVAETCAINGVSYFDFSEDVETTNYIKSLSGSNSISRNSVMVPQCGLAPGEIGRAHV